MCPNIPVLGKSPGTILPGLLSPPVPSREYGNRLHRVYVGIRSLIPCGIPWRSGQDAWLVFLADFGFRIDGLLPGWNGGRDSYSSLYMILNDMVASMLVSIPSIGLRFRFRV